MKLKEKLISEPVLHFPDFTLMFRVYTDGSSIGTGGILVQEFPNEGERVIAYTSKVLQTREEQNYSATELECLAVLHALQAFKPYLDGYRFEVVTDHASLKWLMSLKNPAGRLARWVMELQQFDFFITHRKGKCMEAPDALSRNPVRVDLINLPEEIQDQWYNELHRKVESNPEEYEKFAVQDGRLFKLISIGNTQPLSWIQVLPKDSRQQALRDAHDAPTSGHGGWFRTLQRLRQNCYWPNMSSDVKHYVESCDVCQRRKIDRSRPPGMMGTPCKVSQPFEVLSSDLIGPLPRSSAGNTALLVTTDYFSKYIVLKPLRKATAKAVCHHLEKDIFLVHGVPSVLMVDNGPQYRAQETQKLCARYNVNVKYNLAYNPRSNPTERQNQTVETMICSFVEENHKHWDKLIPEIQFAMRSSVGAVTGFSPNRIVLGYEVSLDGRERPLRRNVSEVPEVEPREEYVEKQKQREDIITTVQTRLRLAKERNAKRYNLRRRPLEYPVGMDVLRRNFVLSNAANHFSAKLAPRWIGPYKIKARVGNVSYLLEKEDGKEDGPWHVDQLKRYVGRVDRSRRVLQTGGGGELSRALK